MNMFKNYCTLLLMVDMCIQYYAHGATLRNAETLRAYEGAKVLLECTVGQTINVTSVKYGQGSQKSACSEKQSQDNICCKTVTVVIANRCNGQEICEINMNSQEFGDSCPEGTLKEAEVEFYCLGGEQVNRKNDDVARQSLIRRKKNVQRKGPEAIWSTKKPKKTKRKM